MALIDLLKRYLGSQPPRSDYEDNIPIGQTLGGSIQSYVQAHSYTGESITPHRAMEAPSVFSCVNLISSSVARLEWQILRENPEGKINEPSHPLYNLLNTEWSDDVGAMQGKELLLQSALLSGNGYAYIHRDARGVPVALEPIRADYIQMYRDGENQPYYQVYGGKYTGTDTEKVSKKFRAYDVFHLVGPSSEGLLGIPPIHRMRDLIGLELVISEYVTRFYANNAVPSGTLSMPGKLSPEASKRLREAWTAAHGGASRAGRVAVLEDGLKYQQLSSTMKENDLIEMRRYCRQQIAAAFQVPSHKIGDSDGTSYNSAEQADSEFVKHTLSGWAQRLEQEASRKLIVRGQPYCTRISFDSLLRADMSTRYAAYAVAVTNGLLTPNECRALEGRPAMEGGNAIRVPLNTTAASSAQAQPDAVPAVPASVDVAPVEMLSSATDIALAVIKPAVQAAFARNINKVTEYLVKQRTQSKLDKWHPPIEDLHAELRACIVGLGSVLDAETSLATLDAYSVGHAGMLRQSVGAIADLSTVFEQWEKIPVAATEELLKLINTGENNGKRN